jgi:hypothetical protein
MSRQKQTHAPARVQRPKVLTRAINGIRISPATETALLAECARLKMSISDFVRDALASVLHVQDSSDTFELPAMQKGASAQVRETSGELPDSTL